MKTSISFNFITTLAVSVAVFLGLAVAPASADQVILRNGDILNGKVLAMSTNTLTLQDESLGTLILSRARVSNIAFGTAAAALPAMASPQVNSGLNLPAKAGTPNTGQTSSQVTSISDSALAGMFRDIREHSNLVQQVEAQVLGSSADPAAVNKFNQMLDELGSGQMDMNGLRAEAQNAANELQEYEKQLGPDSDDELKGYLSILNNFLQETAPTNGP